MSKSAAEYIISRQSEAELSVLGAVLICPELYPEAAEILTPDDFDYILHKTLFEKMGKLYGETGKVDLIALLENLPAANDDDRRQNKEYLMRLSDSVPVVSNLSDYCDYVKKRSIGRKAVNIIKNSDLRGLTGADIAETVQSVAEQLSELVRDKGRAKMKNIKDVLHEIYRNVYEETEDISIGTGFWRLDKLLDGIYPGDLITIGAGTSVGKTAFALQIIANMAKKGKKITLYSQEMTEKQNVQRIVSRLSGVEVKKLKRADRTSETEKQKVSEACEIAYKYLVNISSEGGLRVSDIRLDCVKNKDIDIIFIDHVGLMRGEKGVKQGRTEELSQIMKDIRALALQINKPIILLAQFNRDIKPEVSKKGVIKYIEPQLHHFKDSSEVEQSSGTIVLLWRMPGYDDEKSPNYRMIGVKVEKNRQGETGKMYMKFDAPIMNFTEVYDYNPPAGFVAADENLEEMGF